MQKYSVNYACVHQNLQACFCTSHAYMPVRSFCHDLTDVHAQPQYCVVWNEQLSNSFFLLLLQFQRNSLVDCIFRLFLSAKAVACVLIVPWQGHIETPQAFTSRHESYGSKWQFWQQELLQRIDSFSRMFPSPRSTQLASGSASAHTLNTQPHVVEWMGASVR